MEEAQENITPPETKAPILKKIVPPDPKKLILIVLLSIAVVMAGVATGWFLSQKGKEKASKTTTNASSQNKDSSVVGITNEAVLKDSAQGVLEEGGINGEGTHHLTRDGGPSQYVYLTSSVIDLGTFVGKKVQVWGETIGGKKAGWLMDVGRVKILE